MVSFANRRTLRTDSATLAIAAPAELVYDLVADVTRMGEWSPECLRCEWVDGANGPEVGARFRAHNRRRGLRWSNSPIVTVADRGREFAFTRRAKGAGEYVWRYSFEPGPDGTTVVTESYDAVRPESWFVSTMAHLFTPGDEATFLHDAMEATLERLKRHAEGTGDGVVPTGP